MSRPARPPTSVLTQEELSNSAIISRGQNGQGPPICGDPASQLTSAGSTELRAARKAHVKRDAS